MSAIRRHKAFAIQAAVLAGVLLLAVIVIATTAQNLEARGIPFGFAFLDSRAGFSIAESVIDYTPDASNTWAIVVGIGNTIFISAVVIVFSTLFGTLLGVMRLSENPLAVALARTWIELARNTPLLLLLLFTYTIWWILPPTAIYSLLPGVYASMRGVFIPWPSLRGHGWLLAGILVLVIAALLAARTSARRVQERTGRRPPHVPLAMAAALVGAMLVLAWSGASIVFDWPVADAKGIIGGLAFTPEASTLLIGLIFYTTGYVAEIVRGGINSVAVGQWEASRALGLPRRRILKLVILPQMMRAIVPPMTSQYINVVKNSTLAMAVGYSDFMVVMGTVINKTSHAIEGTVIVILVYLAINLVLSAVLNAYNRRLAVEER